MIDLNVSTAALDAIGEPTDADLADVQTLIADSEGLTVAEWAAILDAEAPLTVKKVDEDFWNEDDNVHDDRYDGSGIPSWSAWA